MFLSSTDLFCSSALLRALISFLLSSVKLFRRALSLSHLAWFINSEIFLIGWWLVVHIVYCFCKCTGIVKK
jgi:hypothetical protein